MIKVYIDLSRATQTERDQAFRIHQSVAAVIEELQGGMGVVRNFAVDTTVERLPLQGPIQCLYGTGKHPLLLWP